MTKAISDDAMARYLIENAIVASEKIDAARAEQAKAAQQGTRISLLEALDKCALISPRERERIDSQLDTPTEVRIRKLGKYKLIRKIGAGGMGAVYIAEDTVTPRTVALKVLSRERARDEEFLTRFQREAKAAIRLQHPNLVTAYATGQDYGRHYYVMEFCEGDTLETILTRDGFLPWEKALGIVIQIARGLEHAHTQNFIHRDIKPGNVFVTRDGVAKILDMGLLKHVSNGKQSFSSRPGLVVGSPHYSSPEQIHASKNIDCRADIYSLGATFFHLLTGRTPFLGETPVMVLMRHLDAPIPNPQGVRPEIPADVARIVQRMMAKEADGRYANCTELLRDLEAAGKKPSSGSTKEGSASFQRLDTRHKTAGLIGNGWKQILRRLGR